jgi:hypothetical protein
MDLLEAIDRSYPEDQVDDDIIENKQNVSINFARTSQVSNQSGYGGRGGDQRSSNNQFNGECFRCNQFGHRMFECPNRPSNAPIQSQFQGANQSNRGFNNNNNSNRSMNSSFNSGSSATSNSNGNWRRNVQSNQREARSNRSFGNQQNAQERGNNAQVNNMATTQNFVNSTVANNSYDNDDNGDNQSNYSLPSTIHSNSVSVRERISSTAANSEFPFYTNGNLTIHNNTTETIVMSKDVTNENRELGGSLLVTTVFANVFDNKPREMKCLIDGGSTHSFISPLAVADKYLKRIKAYDREFTFKNFKIIGATGTVNSKCCVITCPIELGEWRGEQSFVISDKVARYDMVVGRDFLKSNKAKIDHGDDCIKLDGTWISIRDEGVTTVNEDVHTSKIQAKLGDMASGEKESHCLSDTVSECVVIGNHIIKAGSQRLVPFKLIDEKFREIYEKNEVGIFEGKCVTQYGCLIAKSVHDVHADNFYCNVMNTSSETVRFKHGGIAGQFSRCELAGSKEEEAMCNLVESSSEKKVRFSDEKAPCVEDLNKNLQKLVDIKKLKVNSSLSSEQKVLLGNVLLKHHAQFAWDEETLGRTHILEHSVPTGSHPPIVQPQYPIPSMAQEAMREQVQDMVDKNIIRDSSSNWCSPVLLIKKILADGSIKYRFCIDLRKVNDATEKDCYSLPRIDETVDALCGAQFFSSMDIDRAFWQIAMAEEDKHKFAFRVDGRLFEPNVMPFGSKNAPSTFQRLMDKILRGLTWKQCLVYIDDILVFAGTFDEHCRRLDAVLERIGSCRA